MAPNSRVTACSPFSKFIQTLLRTSRLTYLFAVVIFCSNFVKFGPEVQYILSHRNLQRKVSCGAKSSDLSNQPVGSYIPIDEFRIISFKSERTGLSCEGKLQTAGKQLSMGVVELLTGRKRLNLKIIDIFQCFIIEILWSYHTMGIPSTLQRYFFAVQFILLNLFRIFCAPNLNVLCTHKFWDVKKAFIWKTDLTYEAWIRLHVVRTRLRKLSLLSRIFFVVNVNMWSSLFCVFCMVQ